jgi:hypothetical protein
MSFITKRLCNTLFNTKKTSTDELNIKIGFIHGVMIGSGYECKEFFDLVEFNKEFKPNWVIIYERYILNDKKEWIIFNKDDKENVEFVNHLTYKEIKEPSNNYIR